MAKTSSEKWVLMTELNGEPLLHHFKLSNHGRVVRIKKGVGQEESFLPKEIGGYKYISFTTRNGSRETIYLHRLVAEFFVEPSGDQEVFVIHKDYNRKNNRHDNLEWVTKEVLYKHRSAKAGRLPGSSSKRKRLQQSGGITNEDVAVARDRFRKRLSQHLGLLH